MSQQTYQEPGINWRTMWIGYLGNMPSERAKAWEEIIATEIPEARSCHMQAAVKCLCHTWAGDNAPTLRYLKSEIKRTLLQSRGIAVEIPFEVRQLKRKIEFAPVHGLMRWNLACEALAVKGGTSDHAEMLCKHAVATGGLVVPFWAGRTFEGASVMSEAEYQQAGSPNP